MVGALVPHAAATLWLIPALPLLGAAINLFAGNRLGRWAGILATLTVALSFGVSLAAVLNLLTNASENRLAIQHLFEWISVGGFQTSVQLALVATIPGLEHAVISTSEHAAPFNYASTVSYALPQWAIQCAGLRPAARVVIMVATLVPFDNRHFPRGFVQDGGPSTDDRAQGVHDLRCNEGLRCRRAHRLYRSAL